jgi:aminoglycoside phosphotransferase (APT) family kinase protein
VSAIIDWELWSVSDPRLDLAWFRLHSSANGNAFAGRNAPGMASAAELADTYLMQRSLDLGELAWFDALVRFKQAAAAALIVKHARRREGPTAAAATAGAIPRHLELAGELLR